MVPEGTSRPHPGVPCPRTGGQKPVVRGCGALSQTSRELWPQARLWHPPPGQAPPGPHLLATCGPLPARPGPLPKERPGGAASWRGWATGPATEAAPSVPGLPARGPTASGDAAWRHTGSGSSRGKEARGSPGRLRKAAASGRSRVALTPARRASSPFPRPPGPPPSPRHLWPQAAPIGRNWHFLEEDRDPSLVSSI